MKVLIIMFIAHFVADFLMQDRETAKNKSTQFRYLFKHLMDIYSVFLLSLLYFTGIYLAVKLAFCNMIIHGMIDWNIWRGYKWSVVRRITKSIKGPLFVYNLTDNKFESHAFQDALKNWKYWEDHWFYATIGFDQLLHGLTIIGLVWYFV